MSQSFGKNKYDWESDKPFYINCNDTYIKKIKATSYDGQIRSIGAQCQNSAMSGPFGGLRDEYRYFPVTYRECLNGFNGMKVMHGWGVNAIQPLCNDIPQPLIGDYDTNVTLFECPPGKVITSISGSTGPRKDGKIGRLTLECGDKVEAFNHYKQNLSLNSFILMGIIGFIVLWIRLKV